METNLKDALEYAVQLSEDNKKTQEINGKTFVDVHRANFKSVEEIEKRRAQALKVSTLTGIVDYIKSGFDKTGTLMVHVASPKAVEVFSPLDEFRQREVILVAECQLSRFPFGRFLRQDEFIINMQSYMANHGADDFQAVVECASSIRIDNSGDLVDNGVSQQVTVVQGAATKEIAKVPSPAILQPYRTFLDVEQPSSSFIFRVDQEGNCALFEADGGVWEYDAIEKIKQYLEICLQEEVEAGSIKIIA